MPRIAWEDDILGLVPKTDWLDVGTIVTRPNDPVDQVIDDTKTDNLVAEWESLAAEFQIPVMAQFHGFDTEAKTTFRVPVDRHNIEKGLIKVKINQSERMRTLLRSGVQNDDLYDYIIRDGIRLSDQVVTRSKVAKNELLATGKVTIKENNLNLTVDYGVPNANTSLTLDLSSSADVISQIQTIVDNARNAGVTITGMYTGSANINKMRQNAGLQTAINGNIGAGSMLRKTVMEEFLSEEFGINTVLTNDLTYGKSASIGSNGRPNITTARYYPANKVTFFATNPGGRLGRGLWGDPPEIDNARFYSNEEPSSSPFVYVTQKMEWDPAVLWTKASALFMPVLFNPNSLYVATVSA
jgi:hypothetical protein